MSRIDELYARIAEADRPEVFITLRSEDEVAAEYERSVAAGGPLAGVLLAVKDNVDVAGVPTTAGCPGFAYTPEVDAPAVAALRAAGAVVVGKTNLDQFATGLVGTRSPYGAVRDSRRPDRISGGSSSGSAVAVALGFADIAIGTDTAGSGRVPAGLQGIVGIKPTVGVVSTAGVVPACASYDVVTVFAADLALADRSMSVMAEAAGTRPFPQS
ncbi:putative allophanate hydrolase, partial [Gordonia terrae NBRC 100016]